MGKKKRKYDKGASVGFLMALPTVLGLILLNIYPLCRTVYMSFFKSGGFWKMDVCRIRQLCYHVSKCRFLDCNKKYPVIYVTDSACDSYPWFINCSTIKSEYQW